MKKIQIFHWTLAITNCERLFVNALNDCIEKTEISIYSALGLLKERIEISSVIIFIIPILGDNDLSREYARLLNLFLSRSEVRGCSVIVVFKGDRHVNDLVIPEESALTIKINNIFCLFNSYWLCREKLDEINAEAIGNLIGHRLTSLPVLSRIEQEIDKLSHLLKCRIKWNAEKKIVDFFNKDTGFSTLYRKRRCILEKVSKSITELEAEGLIIRHAEMSESSFDMLVPQDSARILAVDASGNHLSLNGLLKKFPACKWISMADNKLRTLSIEDGPASLNDLYLHKNNLNKVKIFRNLPFSFRKLSFYRNNLKNLDFPDDQVQLTHINLGANPITDFPDTLEFVPNLQFVGIGRTGITSLPNWLLEKKSLKKLDISYVENQLPVSQVNFLRQRGIDLVMQPGKFHK